MTHADLEKLIQATYQIWMSFPGIDQARARKIEKFE